MSKTKFWVALLGSLFLAPVSYAEDQLKVGMLAPPSIVAEFFTGKWSERGSACPVLVNRDATKVAVFVKRLDDPIIPLIGEMEKIVANDGSLKWSFVFVSHENSPTPSQEEWDAQISQIKKLANDKAISHLSIGSMLRIPDNSKSVRAKRQLGFFGDGDVVVMLINPDQKKNRGLIQFVEFLKTRELNKEKIEQISSQLKVAIANAKKG